MPKAEYVPYSTVKPEGPRNVAERVDINYPHVEFRNSIGQALAQTGEGMQTLSRSVREVGGAFDSLGKTFDHVGDQLWQRAQGLQEVQNQTVLTKAEIEYDKYAGDQQIAFNQLQGDAANEQSYKAHLTDLEDKRKTMLEKLLINLLHKDLIRALLVRLADWECRRLIMLQLRLGSLSLNRLRRG
jgi:hypothetical protein